jgi:hypothetical protein
MIFYNIQVLIAFYAIFVRRKSMYFRSDGSFKSTNHKKLVPQITNPQRVTFAEGPQIYQIL